LRSFADIDELKAAVGESWGHSGWRPVTQEEVDQFAAATGDYQWIHVDPVRAADGPFGRTIAHGYLTLSLIPGMLAEVYDLQGVSMAVNYGANRLRFPAPVPVGSRVRGSVEGLALEASTLGYQLTLRVTVELEGGPKPACVAEIITVVVP
jgi:acyl dehydratase